MAAKPGSLKRRCLILASIGLVLSSLLASAESVDSDTVWTTRGVVVNPHLTPNSMMISHEAIEGLMPAMTMPFALESRLLAEDVGYDDSIELEFRQLENRFVIQSIKKLATAESVRPSAPAVASSREVNVPWDIQLVDTKGMPLALKNFEEDIIIVNFIFTRCPLLCPMQTANMQLSQSKLSPADTQRVRYVSISLDPDNDTPEQLALYAKTRGIQTSNWSLLTGEADTVNRVLNSFNVVAIDRGGGDINHTSPVFLICAHSNIIREYDGGSVSIAEDLYQDVKRLAKTECIRAE